MDDPMVTKTTRVTALKIRANRWMKTTEVEEVTMMTLGDKAGPMDENEPVKPLFFLWLYRCERFEVDFLGLRPP